MMQAAEWIVGFYAFVLVYIALYIAGQRFAAWLESRADLNRRSSRA